MYLKCHGFLKVEQLVQSMLPNALKLNFVIPFSYRFIQIITNIIILN